MLTRRLPVYLLLDTSGSMRGEPIEAVNRGLKVLVSSLRQDPNALETAFLSIITFDDKKCSRKTKNKNDYNYEYGFRIHIN